MFTLLHIVLGVKEKITNQPASLEAQSLLGGEQRTKFKSLHLGTLTSLFAEKPGLESKFLVVGKQIQIACDEMEKSGAAPTLPDGKVGGNAAVLLTHEQEDFLVVTKSGKSPNCLVNIMKDLCIVTSFDTKAWSACYYSEKENTVPTSDTPLHHSALSASKSLGWSEIPSASLHGHALASIEEAAKHNLPISTEETLFSTPADSKALLDLLMEYAYPKHKIFIRKDHGFVILGGSMQAATDYFRTDVMPLFV